MSEDDWRKHDSLYPTRDDLVCILVEDWRDVARLVAIAKANGVELTRAQAAAVWHAESHSVCAGWLVFYDDDATMWKYMAPWVDLAKEKFPGPDSGFAANCSDGTFVDNISEAKPRE